MPHSENSLHPQISTMCFTSMPVMREKNSLGEQAEREEYTPQGKVFRIWSKGMKSIGSTKIELVGIHPCLTTLGAVLRMCSANGSSSLYKSGCSPTLGLRWRGSSVIVRPPLTLLRCGFDRV
ncbi:hypothetical protein QAD02_004569 [Eretmocerus hayati]|uniref:Uncharacterized protein n=1 Tax=Eretmocerus hayati TaxID=131215 RepID=A0ACC2NQC0_9HYME|nr:hypothetical protein QAD02_004569 [Eretmocerus hayati]